MTDDLDALEKLAKELPTWKVGARKLEKRCQTGVPVQ